eukprot:scaffold238364_cov25-Prasinocladus_malaysianus.AAC.2
MKDERLLPANNDGIERITVMQNMPAASSNNKYVRCTGGTELKLLKTEQQLPYSSTQMEDSAKLSLRLNIELLALRLLMMNMAISCLDSGHPEHKCASNYIRNPSAVSNCEHKRSQLEMGIKISSQACVAVLVTPIGLHFYGVKGMKLWSAAELIMKYMAGQLLTTEKVIIGVRPSYLFVISWVPIEQQGKRPGGALKKSSSQYKR